MNYVTVMIQNCIYLIRSIPHLIAFIITSFQKNVIHVNKCCQTKFTLKIVYPDFTFNSYPDGTYIQVEHGLDIYPAVVCKL